MCPGGDKKAVESVLPFLRKFVAKDHRSGEPCVDYMGPRGAGSYIKMVHNGIETGILSGTCEAWALMHKNLGIENDETGKTFEAWNAEGELKNNFLIQIGSEIAQKKKTPQGDGRGEGVGDSGYVLDDIVDKVVQDADNTEATFFWTVEDGSDSFGELYAYHSYGLTAARTSKDEGWNVDLGKCIRIWRAGCIIQSDYISDLFAKPFGSSPETPIMNMKLIDEVAAELRKQYPALKEVILKATEWDAYVPGLSASLEYMKYIGGKRLPTQFMEAEMDFFGWHSYDVVGSEGDPGQVKQGKHHYEWRPA